MLYGMKRGILIAVAAFACALLAIVVNSHAALVEKNDLGTDRQTFYVDPSTGQKFSMQVIKDMLMALACERVPEMLCVVEERYLTIPIGGTDAMLAADQLIKTGAGYVRSLTCYSDATATAGTIALRDSTVAGSGNILWSFDVLAVAYNTPFTVDVQTPFSVGLYLDFTTTADVKCMVRYR